MPPPRIEAVAPPAEKRADIVFAAKDEALRQDVHRLGEIVGQLLREQGDDNDEGQPGDRLFAAVEEARQKAIARREGDPDAADALDALLAGLDATLARDFIRAFSTYFQAVNAAEQVHRIRRRRDYMREGLHRQPGGIEDILCRLRDAGVTLDEFRQVLPKLCFQPVLTAHPTEPTRRTILRRQQDIVRRLLDLQNAALSPAEVATDFENIHGDLATIWQTEEHPGEARTVGAEIEHVLYFVTDIVYRIAPVITENFLAAAEVAWGPAARGLEPPVLFRMGSLIGGDLVGRAEITARTIRETLARQRGLVLDLYYRECRELAEKLSQSTGRVPVLEALTERTRLYSGHFPNTAGIVPARHRDMPYRVFLRLVMARLQSTYSDGLYPYESAAEFAADIDLVIASLTAHRGQHAGLFPVQRLRRRIATFGFHLLTLDIRVDAAVNRRVVGRCLGEADWEALDPAARTERLRRALRDNESPAADLDNEAKRLVGVFQAVAFLRRRYSDDAVGPCLISHFEGVDDALSVLLLAQWGQLRRTSGAVPLDIAPEFDSIARLEAAPALLGALARDPVYGEHIAARAGRQKVGLAVPDTNVDADLASARVALFRAQRDLMAVADAVGMELIPYHGAPGAIRLGGGKSHADVLCAPPGTVRGRVRAEEPGELIAIKYGVRAIAVRTIEQALAAVTESTARPVPLPADGRWEEVAAFLASATRERYQALVLHTPGFADYYRLATPADVIERLRRGAAPGALVAEGLLAAAGTAPWVFAWTQSRNILPGWFGMGTGLARTIEHFGEERLRAMLGGWHFFRTLIGDVEMALAKSDLGIAARYSALAGPLHDRFYPEIRAEFDLAVRMVLTLRQQRELLETSNTLRRSIRLRNPYVDPMSLLQVELLRRWRESGDETLLPTLIASVDGIARGMQDAG
jgi:phosphoenolpyruvate carboxylase